MKLSDIHQKYDTDKGTVHTYIDKYDDLFGSYQNDTFNFLEIGCLTCGSIKMFNEFFTHAHIYGLDNWAQTTDHTLDSSSNLKTEIENIKKDIEENYARVHLITCDSTNVEQVKSRLDDVKFKFILDDGDHSYEAQLQTFKNFLPYLDKGGTYIIEDVCHVHIDRLCQSISEYLSLENISMSIEPQGWYRNNRADDAIIVIR
ncbi:class I SAM-dependent methyltransferase [bacterium]|nr:class I SAM-dependent methyltransferase [Candidatus Elulimicrobium humile]